MILLSAALLATMACGDRKGNTPAPAPESTVLAVSCPEGTPTAVIRRYGRVWAVQHQADLQIAPPRADSTPDVRIISTVELAREASAGKLLPVPASLEARSGGYVWHGLLPVYRSKLLTWDGKAYALPLLGHVSVLYYRQDRFSDAATQAAFHEKYARPLALPETWEDLADIAEFFRSRGDVTSLPPLPDDGRALADLFFRVAASYDRRAIHEDEPKKPGDVELFSFHYDLETMQPRIDRPAFVHALRLLQRLQKCRPGGSSASAPEAFRRGEAVLCIADTSWLEKFQSDGSKVRNKFSIARLPGSALYHDYHTGKPIAAKGNHVPYLGAGGWLAVVPAGATNPDAAFQLIAHLSNPTTSTDIVAEPAWGAGPYRREHLSAPDTWAAFGLRSERAGALLDALRINLTPTCINPVVFLRTPDAAEHVKALSDELRAALSKDGYDAAEVLAAAVKRWQALDVRKDIETRRREYRLSLGLAARPR